MSEILYDLWRKEKAMQAIVWAVLFVCFVSSAQRHIGSDTVVYSNILFELSIAKEDTSSNKFLLLCSFVLCRRLNQWKLIYFLANIIVHSKWHHIYLDLYNIYNFSVYIKIHICNILLILFHHERSHICYQSLTICQRHDLKFNVLHKRLYC